MGVVPTPKQHREAHDLVKMSLAVKQFTGWTTADLVRMSKTGEAIWGARAGEATRPEAGEAEAPLEHEHTQGREQGLSNTSLSGENASQLQATRN